MRTQNSFLIPFLLLSLLLCAVTRTAQAAPPLSSLSPGTVLTHSTKIVPGVYALPNTDDGGKTGAITIRGDDLTLDFQGATLQGTPPETAPDQRQGTGLLVEGRNVTLKNLRVRGYKIGLLARQCPGLKILDSDFSYNWKQHLHSTPEREDESDWMSYHHNEGDEWLRYGAGISLWDCDDWEVRGTTIRGGQCGLMLTRCQRGRAWNCDFSFLSGLGIGLYRACNNRLMHNKIDWCVRGFSYGVYNRGQDSAGILLFEQSSRNTVAYNSVTHGGDGFFLWAGQSTMDAGTGGCNDNLIYGNDFSHAPTNGIEVTFSRNTIVNNNVEECDHGIWGGYSFDTLILGNRFARNRRAIAIEHGQHNRIVSNVINGDGEGIVLWQNPTQDPAWGYPKHHDTVSHDYTLARNLFRYPKNAAINLRDTTDVRIERNALYAQSPALTLTGKTDGLLARDNAVFGNSTLFAALNAPLPTRPTPEATLLHRGNTSPDSGSPPPHREKGEHEEVATENAALDAGLLEEDWQPFPHQPGHVLPGLEKYAPKPMHGGSDPFLKAGALQGRRYIVIDEWGPYDFQSPRLVPLGPTPATDTQIGKPALRFAVWGPPGNWRVKSREGVESMSRQSGRTGDTLDVALAGDRVQRTALELEYVGAATTDYRGIVTPTGTPVAFGWSRFDAPIAWNVRFYAWDAPADPRTQPAAFAKLIGAGKPLATLTTTHLDFAGQGHFAAGVPADHFATVADGTLTMPPGEYVLDITTDDGCRVWLDGKQILNEWHYQGPTTYPVSVTLGGTHRLHVEHFQIDGYAALQISLRPKP